MYVMIQQLSYKQSLVSECHLEEINVIRMLLLKIEVSKPRGIHPLKPLMHIAYSPLFSFFFVSLLPLYFDHDAFMHHA